MQGTFRSGAGGYIPTHSDPESELLLKGRAKGRAKITRGVDEKTKTRSQSDDSKTVPPTPDIRAGRRARQPSYLGSLQLEIQFPS